MAWFKKTEEAPKNPPVRVSDYLSEKTISFFSAGPSKQQVFGRLLASLDLVDPGAALKAILTREETGSTVILPGFALPHARLSGLKKLEAALGLCASGVIDPRAKGEPIKVYLLFLGRTENMKEHLGFLAAVSSVFQSDAMLKKLLSQTSAADVLNVLRDAEKTL